MHVAFVAFDDMTALDLVGPFDALTRLETMDLHDGPITWELVSPDGDEAVATAEFPVRVDAVGSLADADLVVVPGGAGARARTDDDAFLDWLRTADPDIWASVCTGSLLLGAAGILEGRRATTHPTAYDLLEPYCEAVVRERVVDEDTVVTARGVTSGIDLGLHLVERIAGRDARERATIRMDYQTRTETSG